MTLRSRLKNGGRGIYILPSLFTSAGLFAGFYALIAAIQSDYSSAAWALIAAGVFDALDGRVARLLHAESKFGAEYDSLCDMVSFGLAPAVLLYLWALTPMNKAGWMAAFLMAACAGLRLARFNAQVASDKRHFQGYPTPAMAGMVATSVLFFEHYEIEPMAGMWFVIALVMAVLMVSRLRFFSGKDVDLRKRRSFTAVVFMLFILTLILADPHNVLFVMSLLYIGHGVVISFRHRRQSLKQRDEKKEEVEAANAGDE